MKIIHDLQKCISCGVCSAICPDFWEMKDEDNKAHLKKGKLKGDKEELEVNTPPCVKEAADSCPVQAIEIE